MNSPRIERWKHLKNQLWMAFAFLTGVQVVAEKPLTPSLLAKLEDEVKDALLKMDEAIQTRRDDSDPDHLPTRRMTKEIIGVRDALARMYGDFTAASAELRSKHEPQPTEKRPRKPSRRQK